MNKVRNRNKVENKVKSHTKNHIDIRQQNRGSDHKKLAIILRGTSIDLVEL